MALKEIAGKVGSVAKNAAARAYGNYTRANSDDDEEENSTSSSFSKKAKSAGNSILKWIWAKIPIVCKVAIVLTIIAIVFCATILQYIQQTFLSSLQFAKSDRDINEILDYFEEEGIDITALGLGKYTVKKEDIEHDLAILDEYQKISEIFVNDDIGGFLSYLFDTGNNVNNHINIGTDFKIINSKYDKNTINTGSINIEKNTQTETIMNKDVDAEYGSTKNIDIDIKTLSRNQKGQKWLVDDLGAWAERPDTKSDSVNISLNNIINPYMVKGQLLTAAYLASGLNMDFVKALKDDDNLKTEVEMKEYPYTDYTKYEAKVSGAASGGASTTHTEAEFSVVYLPLIESINCWFATVTCENTISVTIQKDGVVKGTYISTNNQDKSSNMPITEEDIKAALDGTVSIGHPINSKTPEITITPTETVNTKGFQELEKLLDDYAINKDEFFSKMVSYLSEDEDTNSMYILKFLNQYNESIGNKYYLDIPDEVKSYQIQMLTSEFWSKIADAIQTENQYSLDDLLKYYAPIYMIDQQSGSVDTLFNYSGADYIVKTDESNAAPTATREQLEAGIRQWTKGEMQTNALSVLDDVLRCEERYHVNAIFMYALLRDESGIGTGDTQWVAENNWTSLTSLGHINYDTPGDNIEKMAKMIATGRIYFTQGLVSVYSIGAKYCADPPPPAWADNVSAYMTDLYNCMGVDISTYMPGSSFLETAKICHDILANNQWYYSYVININAGYFVKDSGSFIQGTLGGKSLEEVAALPMEKRYTNCSDYVSWVLYTFDPVKYADFKTTKNSATILSAAKNGKYGFHIVPSAQKQPGDILVCSHHTEIYAGEGKVYNAGATNAIRAQIQNAISIDDWELTVVRLSS